MITKRAVDDIAVGNWEDILRIPMRVGGQNDSLNPDKQDELKLLTLKYLQKIPELEELQLSHENPSKLKSQKFAKLARRGLLVTSFEYC